MWFKILFFVAIIYVVNASVITITISDDDAGDIINSKDTVSLRSCNYRECDQRCRRLKFPGGACVNGRCKCDNFRSAEFATIIDDYMSLKNCNPQECDQRCRRLKFPGGACVNGRCKCDLFRSAQDLEDPETDLTPNRCNFKGCMIYCRKLGYRGGICTNGQCRCNKSIEEGTTESSTAIPNITVPTPLDDTFNNVIGDSELNADDKDATK